MRSVRGEADPTSRRGIRESFAWRTGRAHLAAALTITLVFLYVARLIHHHREAEGQLERARVCAAALAPGADGDYAEAVDRLQRRYPWLLGVGVLSSSGRLDRLYPDDPLLHRSAEAAATSREEIFSDIARKDGADVGIRSVRVPLNGSDDPTATAGLFLFYDGAGGMQNALLMTAVVLVTGTAFFLLAISQVRWFRQEVSAPLRELSGAARTDTPPGRARSQRVMRWREMADLAHGIAHIREALEGARQQAEAAERNAEVRLKEREAGFDRQLRRALDQAMIDPLTGLRNRRYLDHELERLFAAQSARSECLAAIMLDLDHFKSHNDAFGHKAGDEVLRFVGELIRSAIRPTDHGIRYGGDEFLILLPGADEAQAEAIAERIVRLFSQYAVVLPRLESPLSISAGVASTKDRTFANGLELLAKTDTALYQAKAGGRNTVATACA
ncbi:MAG: GGDEF domain-containing protein [Phycisphaerae bacterium]|nr:GGDEF domain-containing protein [Phycisphaerae bacterium]